MRRRALSLATAILLPALGFLAGAPPAEAAVTDLTGTFNGYTDDTRDDFDGVTNGGGQNQSPTGYWIDRERQNWVLADDLEVDLKPGGSAYYDGDAHSVITRGAGSLTIPAYTTVSSYLLHADIGVRESWEVQRDCPAANLRQAPIDLSDNQEGQYFCVIAGSITFDQDILGVMGTQGTLDGADVLVRDTGTTGTDHNGSSRGMEVLNPAHRPSNVGEYISVSNRTVTFRFSVANQLDHLRIITKGVDRDPIVGCQGRAIEEGDPVPTLTGALRDPDENDFAFVTSFQPAGYGTFERIGERWDWTPFEANRWDGPTDSRDVEIQVRDRDGQTREASCRYVVENVVPAINPGVTQVIDEGQWATQTFTFLDPGHDEWTATVQWSDQAAPVDVPVDQLGKSLTISRFFPDDDPTNTPQDTYTATIIVRDDDKGESKPYQHTVIVRNVDPRLERQQAIVIDEGESIARTFTFEDPGADIWKASLTWSDQPGSVSVPVAGKSVSIGRTFPDDDPTDTPQDDYLATVTVTDDDTGFDHETLLVTVRNVAPAIGAVDDIVIDEGQSITQEFTFIDPGTDTWTADVIWSDQSTSTPVVVDQDGKSFSITRSFPDDDPTATSQDDYVATVTVRDDDRGEHSQTLRVTVRDVAPVVAPIDGDEIDEGQGITRTVSFSDVGLLDTHEVVVDYGDGTVETLTVDPVSRTAELTHVFVDDDPTATPVDTYTVTVTVTDDDTLAGSTTFDVIVHDVAPDIEITSPYSGALYPVGSTVPVTAPFTDPGLADTFVCDWEWDDLLTPGLETFAGTFDGSTGAGNCDAAHTFNEAGVYSVRVTVTDDDTLSDSADILIVIYDPSAGFVTGGGQIDSPAGAYVADPSLTGQATFGFNAKYKKGATVPQGSTEFQFRAGGMNFHSSDLQWLVVTGNKTKAQFKGFGTINGSGDYGFLLTAYDLGNGQGVDQLRMKIWDRSTGDLVYDNSLGSSDDVDAANPMTIARGQIQIH